ncbi:ABC transporter ATP-binding protein [Quadrisphaera sp. DSM 44207]|uniref:ABC transporter ATP-binding protein n=1 Tax=Quadrisphaera sp. DSM 44207 TaxID=1881057 RepID=UPI000885006B|nr:ABC transporter ATP-binding protein [Quadrisphaera sp. DSM 44207]SDQ35818.1 ATP-binding cassette, subfamily B/ATP-binding cassette, subfamily C [Quadrisphaera sp. DSM 44207]
MSPPLATPPARSVLRHVRDLLRPHRARLGVLAVAVVLGALATTAAPLLVRSAVDGALAGREAAVPRAALGIAALALLAGAATAVRLRLWGAVAEGVLAELRGRCLRRVLALSPPQLSRTGRGDVLARTTGDVEVLGEAARLSLPVLVRGLTVLVLAAAVLLGVSAPLAGVAVLGLVGGGLSARRLLRRTTVLYPRYRASSGAALSVLRETLVGVRVVQGHGREAERAAAYGAANLEVVERYADGTRARNGFFPVVIALQSATALAVLAVGAAMASAGAASVGTVSAAVLATVALYSPVTQLTEVLDQLQTARAALGRVVALLDLSPSLEVPDDPRPLPDDGTLAVDGVRFGYRPGQLVLDGVDLVVSPGEVVALVGESGAGKSTLAALAARWADPDAGRVTLGGTDLRDLAPEQLRRAVVVVPQDGHLVRGSVADNVRLARPEASDAEVLGALARLGLRAWAERLPHGVRTPVGHGGGALSAGERQLVALARVALADPQVVVLDEATSVLDPDTAALVDTALHRALQGRAVLLVAHRPDSVQRADRVVRLDRGRVRAP